MKTIYTYKEFLNERLLDKMTPKSDKDIIDSLNKLPENEKFKEACENGVDVVVKQMLDSGYDVNNMEINKELIENGYSKIVIMLLNHGSLLLLHEHDISSGVLSEMEYEMENDESETELQNIYQEKLKSYLLTYIFSGNQRLTDNYYELLDTMEILEEKSKNYFLAFISYKLKIDEPVWF